jgi:hypothetical protein
LFYFQISVGIIITEVKHLTVSQKVMEKLVQLESPSEQLKSPSEQLESPSEELESPSEQLVSPSEQLESPS